MINFFDTYDNIHKTDNKDVPDNKDEPNKDTDVSEILDKLDILETKLTNILSAETKEDIEDNEK